MFRHTLVLFLLVGSLAFLVGCSGSSSTSQVVRISGGGATFVDPIMQKWSGEYKKAKNVEIDYVAKGSGYGITNVTTKNVDFGCSDAPMNAKEIAKAKDSGEVVHIPVTIGAVAIIYNLPEVKDLKLSGEVLGDIYLGRVKTWNDPAIAKLNPGAALPASDITPVRRAEASGTTAIFTEYLSKRNADFAAKPGTDKDPKWPTELLGKNGNDGIAGHVKGTTGTIGYVELAYARKNGIPAATLINKAGKPVAPDAAGVTAAVGSAMKVKQEKVPYSLHALAFSFTDADGDATYPIVGASYAMLFKKQPKDKGPAIVEFLKWTVSEGQKFAPELDYAPLPAELAKKAQELLGTVTFE
jgi:phosphate transport system substrate-binding protein